jgi:hypothetical protein
VTQKGPHIIDRQFSGLVQAAELEQQVEEFWRFWETVGVEEPLRDELVLDEDALADVAVVLFVWVFVF